MVRDIAVPNDHNRSDLKSFSDEQIASGEQALIKVQTKVSSKGRPTVPKDVREMHGLVENVKRNFRLVFEGKAAQLQLFPVEQVKMSESDDPCSTTVTLGKTHALTIPRAWREALQLEGVLVELVTSPGQPIIIEKATRVEETRVETFNVFKYIQMNTFLLVS